MITYKQIKNEEGDIVLEVSELFQATNGVEYVSLETPASTTSYCGEEIWLTIEQISELIIILLQEQVKNKNK